MPWVRATIKGQRVYARAKANGELDASGGRVEIRYKPNDGRKYQASTRNLVDVDGELLPDDACSAAESARETTRSDVKGGAPRKTATHDEAAALHAGPRTVVYTDGACTGNPGPAGIGVVVVLETERIEVSEYLGLATNNIAELTAIERGIAEAAARSALVVHTDSQYAIGVLSKGWRAKANVELIDKIKQRIRAHGKVSFVYVPGHAGVPLNERCDALARQAIRTRTNVTNRIAST